jgi:hypothetical protein
VDNHLAIDDDFLADKRLDCSLGGFAHVSRETAKRAANRLVRENVV